MKMPLIFLLFISVFPLFGQTNTESPHAHFASTNDESFYKPVSWGKVTNDVQFGAGIFQTDKHFGAKKVFTFLLSATNQYHFLQPPRGCRFDMTLRSEAGAEIARTRFGDALCKPPQEKFYTPENIILVMPGIPTPYDDGFDFLKSFKIQKPGKYTLNIRPRLFRLGKRPEYYPMSMPGAELDIVVQQSDLDQ